jgi:ribosomal protein S25
MDNKRLGIILIIIGLLIAGSAFFIKHNEDVIINKFIYQEGTCFLADGTCLHADRNLTGYIVAWIISAILIALGLYLLLFDKSQKAIISTLEKQKLVNETEEKLNILMKGLDEDEQKIIQAVKAQDGITQQTLRLRTDLHKSKLSIVLDRLEKKGLIKRVEKGKTKQVFLKINL